MATKKHNIAHPRLSNHHPGYHDQARFWMWVGVLSVAIMIFALWGFSLKVQFSNIHWSEAPEKKLIETTKANWQASFDEFQTENAKQNVQNQLASALEKIAAEANATVTTTTTTTTTIASDATTTIASFPKSNPKNKK